MNPKLVDIHSHLNFPDFDKDRDEVIERALEAGIWTINIGSNFENSKQAVEIAEKYDGVFAGIGLHPDEKENFNIDYYRQLAKHPKVVTIGECGLDRKTCNLNLETQEILFKKQIELALELDKPLMIHCRDAHEEILDILNSFQTTKLQGNIHFFSGTWEQAQKYFDLGFTISFTGVITFTRDYDEVIRKAPLDKIMIETDAPFVAPVPFRGKRNEPLYVKEVAKKIAEIKNLSFEEVAKATTKTASTLFSLSPKAL
jgi:TatD DNase family protein